MMPLLRRNISNENWHQIQALFEATVGLSREEQVTYLNNHCGNNPDIRHHVERLLRADTLDHSIIRKSIESEASDFLSAAHAGERLGKYRLIREIGRGGMGSVFLAERADDEFSKKTCIKILQNKLASNEERNRFRNERQILANLEHPNIARLLDGGTCDDGTPYLVMEYVDGKPINEYCDNRRLSKDERLRLFSVICRTVHYAHQHGVIHCDIKPANILVTKDGQLKLVDFGISRLLTDDSGTRTVPINKHDTAILTPAYASPEQLSGDSISRESDIYALGVLLYELITGLNPQFATQQEETDIKSANISRNIIKTSTVLEKASSSDDLTKQGNASILENRNTTLRNFQSCLNRELDSIISKAMNPELQFRYATADILSKDIDNFLHNYPVTAYRGTLFYSLYKYLYRHKVVLLAISSMLTAFAIISLYMQTQSTTPELVTVQELITSHTGQDQYANRPTVAILPFETISQNKDHMYLAEGITEELINDLSNLNKLFVIAKTSVLSYKNKEIDLQAIGKELNAKYFVRGSVASDDETIKIKVQLFNVNTNKTVMEQFIERPIVDLFAIQNTISKKITQSLNIEITDHETRKISRKYTDNLTAYKYLIDGLKHYGQRFKQANQTAREHFEAAISLDPEFARAYAVLANTHRSDYINGWSQNPHVSMELAKKFIDKAETLDPDLPQVHFIKGLIYREQKQHTLAMTSAAHAITLNPNYADGFILLASVMCYSGQPANSVALIEKAMRLNPNHPTNYTFHLAQCYFTQGQYQDAVRVFEETLERNPASQRAILWLAASYAHAGKLQQAQWTIEELSSWNSNITLQFVADKIPYTGKNDMDRLLSGLKKAGLHE